MAKLSNFEMQKYSWRPKLFLEKYRNKELFELNDSSQIILNNFNNTAINNIILIHNSIVSGSYLDWNKLQFETENNIKLKISQFKKSKDFGGKSGLLDCGKNNEKFLFEKLSSLLSEPKDIKIKDSSKELYFKNVSSIIDSSLETKKTLNKSDIILVSDKEKYGLSLKMDSAGYYESADSLFKNILIDVVKKVKSQEITGVILTKEITGDKKNNWIIKPEIAINIPDYLMERVIFGTEKSKIIIKTFKDSDFISLDKCVEILCTKIISSIKEIDLTEKPIIIIRNNTNRNKSNPNIRGLRIAVVPKGKRKNAKLINYKIGVKHVKNI